MVYVIPRMGRIGVLGNVLKGCQLKALETVVGTLYIHQMTQLSSQDLSSKGPAIQYTVKLVWDDPYWKDHLVWKDHLLTSENVFLLLESKQTEPVWNDHLSVS